MLRELRPKLSGERNEKDPQRFQNRRVWQIYETNTVCSTCTLPESTGATRSSGAKARCM